MSDLVILYAYYERYFINFASAPNDEGVSYSYRVSLRQRLKIDSAVENPPVVVELDGAPSPFVLSLPDTEDVFATIRTASARISFVDDIDLGELLPSDAFEWKVVLTRTTDGVDIFTGYLTAEVYTQPAVAGPNIVTVNAAAPLAPLSAMEMPIGDIGVLSIGDLLAMLITAATERDIECIYIPAMYSQVEPTALNDYADILKWKFPVSPYVEYTEDGTGYHVSSFAETIDAIGKLLGWALVDVGDRQLFFSSPAYHGFYLKVDVEQLKESNITTSVITPEIVDSTSITPVDMDDVVDFKQGYGRVRITLSSENIDIAIPEFESRIKEQIFSRAKTKGQVSMGDGAGYTTYEAECATLSAILQNPRISTPKYYLSLDSNSLPIWNEIPSEYEALDKQGSVGAFFRKIDWCNPADLDVDSETPKRSWDLSPVIMVRDASYYMIGDVGYDIRLPSDLSILKMDMGNVYIPRGAIKVDFSMMASNIEGFYMVSDNLYEGGSIEESVENLYTPSGDGILGVGFVGPWWGTEKSVVFSIKVGDRYYNGEEWVSTFSTVNIPMDVRENVWHPVASNKTVDMLYDGSSGFYIPVDSPLSGFMEVNIYPCFYPYEGPAPTIGNFPNAYIRNLEVSFANKIEYVITGAGSNIYTRVINDGFKQDTEVSLRLHSKIDAGEYATLLFDSQDSPIDNLYRSTSVEPQKPEQFLLDEYERVYGQTIRSWRRGTWYRDLRPIDLFSSIVEDSTLMITGFTTDFEENTMALNLTEIRMAKIIKDVN